MSSLFAKTITLGKELRISDEEFFQLRDFIYQQCGIHVAENRKYLVENRLANRLKELGLKTFGEYYYFLRYDPRRREELNRLFDVITTNETSFYRNPPQLGVFQENVLKVVLDEQRKKGDRTLRIWSAGCSTGGGAVYPFHHPERGAALGDQLLEYQDHGQRHLPVRVSRGPGRLLLGVRTAHYAQGARGPVFRQYRPDVQGEAGGPEADFLRADQPERQGPTQGPWNGPTSFFAAM